MYSTGLAIVPIYKFFYYEKIKHKTNESERIFFVPLRFIRSGSNFKKCNKKCFQLSLIRVNKMNEFFVRYVQNQIN